MSSRAAFSIPRRLLTRRRQLPPSDKSSLDRALRILDLLPSKPTTSDPIHLRLVKELLANPSTDSARHPFDGIPQPLELNAVILSRELTSCAADHDLRCGTRYHCLAMRAGLLDADAYVGSSLIMMYSRCGEVHNAHKVFEEMTARNVVLWTAIITAFSQDSQVGVCMSVYSEMRISGLEPNDFTFASLLSACSDTGALGIGRGLHCQAIRMGFEEYIHVSNSLISMYCKCGWADLAYLIFSDMAERDIVSWNSMIAGCAHCGLVSQSIGLFHEMRKRNVKPDGITFLAILSSCRHAGFIDLGKEYLELMIESGVTPKLDHYSCLVDLLGRYGKVEEARDFIHKMPVKPNAVIWGSLLSSCRLHGNIWIGIEAAENRLQLKPECASTHVLLANLYASVGCWDEFARIRRLMKDKGVKTCPGYSWIEVSNEVYKFRAEDGSNDRVREIVAVLDCLMDHMQNNGHVIDLNGDGKDDGVS
ncbi:hypothetical protein MLD38_026488 [Melastoma candidum]|uniref:Uncharacterized protein n=1 Tax=Melastoma candidum TaxID=119954 RepID=A0ACB9P047_9MYRT|nr:hypothetical protein MLD38_026488 [Melastoma candidum]